MRRPIIGIVAVALFLIMLVLCVTAFGVVWTIIAFSIYFAFAALWQVGVYLWRRRNRVQGREVPK